MSTLNAPNSLDSHIAQLLTVNAQLLLLTIIATKGSCARKAGTRALLDSDGLIGTLGGGLFEYNALSDAKQLFAKKASSLFTYKSQDDVGRGERTLLYEYLDPSLSTLFAIAAEKTQLSEDAAWILDLYDPKHPKRSLLLADPPQMQPKNFDELVQTNALSIDQRRLELMRAKTGGKPQFYKEGGKSIYVEPLAVPKILLLCGAGHVAVETAELAAKCGFTVDIADDRSDYLSEERLKMARNLFHVPDFSDLAQICGIGQNHYVVIMTHSHDLDASVLPQILSSKATFIGMLAGSAKRKSIFEKLEAKGVPKTELAAVSAPVGLMIGADTPTEIAVSIVAELLAARNGMRVQVKTQTIS